MSSEAHTLKSHGHYGQIPKYNEWNALIGYYARALLSHLFYYFSFTELSMRILCLFSFNLNWKLILTYDYFYIFNTSSGFCVMMFLT